jgi:hypothetical protein
MTLEEILAKLQKEFDGYKKQLAILEDQQKDVNQLPQEAINAMAVLKDKIK